MYLEHELLQAGSAVGVVAREDLEKNNILSLSLKFQSHLDFITENLR